MTPPTTWHPPPNHPPPLPCCVKRAPPHRHRSLPSPFFPCYWSTPEPPPTHPRGEIRAPIILMLFPRPDLTPLASLVLQDIIGATTNHRSVVAAVDPASLPSPVPCCLDKSPATPPCPVVSGKCPGRGRQDLIARDATGRSVRGARRLGRPGQNGCGPGIENRIKF
jgi:hypothetical protein